MDFYDENMLEWIVRGLKKNNQNEQKIRFEITETSLAAIGENHTRMLTHLKENGAEILLDDFGSGYSSFGMLQDYDFDILKMDISFVRNIGVNKKSESILRAIIDMAHQLEIRLVAEGAETEEQVAFLRENGCDYIQGYYYYKPMPEKGCMLKHENNLPFLVTRYACTSANCSRYCSGDSPIFFLKIRKKYFVLS